MRHTRYQGAIVHEDRMLLIRQVEFRSGRTYWDIPGGGLEPGETEEECVAREMREETNLSVQVERLLLDLPEPAGAKPYKRRKTYLCKVLSGEAAPGYEPEEEVSVWGAIVEVDWFDLRAPAEWDQLLLDDPITFPLLQRLRGVLGYERIFGSPVVDGG